MKSPLEKVTKFIQSIDQLVEAFSYEDGLRAIWERRELSDQPRRTRNLRFSDTILLYQDAGTREDLQKLVITSLGVFVVCLQYGFPLRGTLTRAELLVYEDEDIYIGKGLVRAYDLEQRQNWSGALIDTDSIPKAHMETYASLKQEGVVTSYPVPMKRGPVKDRDCLAWPTRFAGDGEAIEADLLEFTDPDDLSWDAYRKARNTMEFWKKYHPEGDIRHEQVPMDE